MRETEPDDPDWKAMKAWLAQRLGEGAMHNWIEKLAFHGLESGAVVLSAGSRFVLDWVRQNYESQIVAAARAAGLPVGAVRLRVSDA